MAVVMREIRRISERKVITIINIVLHQPNALIYLKNTKIFFKISAFGWCKTVLMFKNAR
jgi:hypothetical protein